MKNRIYNLTPDQFYAIERSARLQRAKEMGRLSAALVTKIARLFQASENGAQRGGKAAGHA